MSKQARLVIAERGNDLARALAASLAAHGLSTDHCTAIADLLAYCRPDSSSLALVNSDLLTTDEDWRAIAGLPAIWLAVAPYGDADLSARLRRAGATTVILRDDDLPGRLADLVDLLGGLLQEHELLRGQRELALALGHTRQPAEIFRAVTDAVLGIAEFDAAGVYLVDDDGGGLHLVHCEGISEAFAAGVGRIPREYAVGRTLFAGQASSGPAGELLPELPEVAAAEGLLGVITLPVWYDDRVIGAVTAGSHAVTEFSRFARLCFESVAAHVGGALARARAEHSLRASEAQYRALAEGSPDLIMRLGPDDELLYANPAFEDLTGLNVERSCGRRLGQIGLPAASATKVEDGTRAVRESGNRVEVQVEIDSLEGPRVIDLRLIPERSSDAEAPACVLAVGRDTTHAVHAAQRLLRAQRMDAFGQLANRMANDFNNELASIMGFAGLLEEQLRPDPGLGSHARNILEACRRCADITGQLLAFARQEKITPRNVDLNDLVAAVAGQVRERFGDTIWVKKRLDARPAVVPGDIGQLRRALLAVAWNACEAMAEGGELLLTTGTREVPGDRDDPAASPGRYVEIVIADTGTGMDTDVQAHIFEPFFTTKQGEGKGMGLAAVYGTIQRHQGAITVASEVGQGTTMSILLPTVATVREGEDRPPTPAPRRAHVLVIDDDSTIRRLLDRVLGELGYRVSVCEDGLSAVEFYQRSGYDVELVILDLVMPEFDGWATLQALRDIDPSLRVVVTSGQELSPEQHDRLEGRASAFLRKPYPINVLANTVAEVIGE